MSNIAGKAYAMSLVTPIDGWLTTLINKLIFFAVGTWLFKRKLRGLQTLSMIHYARWVIVSDSDFPRLNDSQPAEKLRYNYMFFFSNFNGSWAQYVDSFSAAIPSGLDLLWRANVGWPNSVPEQPFHRYVSHNQLFTNHYYSAYPMAASNDVKAAARVKAHLCQLCQETEGTTPEEFQKRYYLLLKELDHDLGQLASTPIVSLAAQSAAERQHKDARRAAHSRST